MNPHNTPKKADSQEIQGLFPFWKKPGETLAVMLRRFREEQGFGPEEKMTYAGRLDPMAEGVVLILVGQARFQKERFLALPKTYEVEILLGLGTDTGDMLGLPTANPTLNKVKDNSFDLSEIEAALKMLAQTVSLPYPNYSSRPIDGKPLFMHARASNEVVLPIKKVSIYDLELLNIKNSTIGDLVAKAIAVIGKVQGDFRQKEILARWQDIQDREGERHVQIVTIRATVSSGTYMRALAEKLGLLLKVPALAYRIVRTDIGNMK